MKQPGQYKTYHIKGWNIRVDRKYRGFDRELLSITDGHFDNVRGPFDKIESSKYARVYKCPVGMCGRKTTFYIKYFLNRSIIDLVKHIFRPGRAMRTLTASEMLIEKGFNCPRVVAVAEKKIGPLCLSSVLVTEEIRNAYDIYCYLLDYWKVNIVQEPSEKRAMIRQLGRTIGSMHAKGIFHGDLRLGNIFAGVDNNEWKFYFIDNERTQCFQKLPWRYRVKNLVQCNMLRDNLSRTDRLRFFRQYISCQRLSGKTRRRLISDVVNRTNQRLSRK